MSQNRPVSSPQEWAEQDRSARGWTSSGCPEESVVSQRAKGTVVANDYGIEDRDADDLAGLHEAFADRPVLGRWRRIAARMVVDEDRRRRVAHDQWLEDLARVNEGGGQRPEAHEIDPARPIFPIEKDNEESLAVETGEHRRHEVCDIPALP